MRSADLSLTGRVSQKPLLLSGMSGPSLESIADFLSDVKPRGESFCLGNGMPILRFLTLKNSNSIYSSVSWLFLKNIELLPRRKVISDMFRCLSRVLWVRLSWRPIFVFGQTVSFYVLTKNLQMTINKTFEFTEFQHCIIFNARTWQLEYRALQIMHRRSSKNILDYIHSQNWRFWMVIKSL